MLHGCFRIWDIFVKNHDQYFSSERGHRLVLGNHDAVYLWKFSLKLREPSEERGANIKIM